MGTETEALLVAGSSKVGRSERVTVDFPTFRVTLEEFIFEVNAV